MHFSIEAVFEETFDVYYKKYFLDINFTSDQCSDVTGQLDIDYDEYIRDGLFC